MIAFDDDRFEYVQIDWDEFETEVGAEMSDMARWFDAEGYAVDVDSLRARYPNLKTLEDYLRIAGWDDQ